MSVYDVLLLKVQNFQCGWLLSICCTLLESIDFSIFSGQIPLTKKGECIFLWYFHVTCSKSSSILELPLQHPLPAFYCCSSAKAVQIFWILALSASYCSEETQVIERPSSSSYINYCLGICHMTQIKEVWERCPYLLEDSLLLDWFVSGKGSS